MMDAFPVVQNELIFGYLYPNGYISVLADHRKGVNSSLSPVLAVEGGYRKAISEDFAKFHIKAPKGFYAS